MHERIYQLDTKPIMADKFITPDDFGVEDYSDFADYIADIDEDTLADEYENFPDFAGAFTRKDDALIFNGFDRLKKEWLNAIHERAEKINEDNILKDAQNVRFNLKDALLYPYTFSRFVFSDEMFMRRSSSFIEECAYILKPGDKLYLGGVLDFHY